MKIHEYQGKEIFKKYQINIPKGIPAFSIEDAKNALSEIEFEGDMNAGPEAKLHIAKIVLERALKEMKQ